MDENEDRTQPDWDEDASQTFVDYGRYFVPQREEQIMIMSALIPPATGPCTILELACGEGLLAERLLADHPACHVLGLDGSQVMRRKAAGRLARFGKRFRVEPFDLRSTSWRRPERRFSAVVSSLAIHHLFDQEKRALFRDVHPLLLPGAPFLIADMVAPAHTHGWQYAADALDDRIRRRALELDGSTGAYEQFQVLRWNTYRYFDGEDIDFPSTLHDQLGWLLEAGYVAADVYWMDAGHAIYGAWKRGKASQN